MNRRMWVCFFKAVISLGLVVYLIQLLNWSSIQAIVDSGLVYQLWPGPIILFSGLVVAAERWRLLLHFYKLNLKQTEALSMYLIGTFYGVMLPGVLGGDVVRIGLCRKKTAGGTTPIMATVTIERGLGLWGVSIIGAIGVLTTSPMLREAVGYHIWLISPVISLAFPIFLYSVFFSASLLIRHKWLSKYLNSFWSALQQIVMQARSLPPALILITLLLSTAFQSAEILIFYYFGSLLGIDAPFSFYLFVVPIVYLSTVLPISLGGVGVREGVLALMFAKIGIPAADAVLLAFLAYLNRIIVALIGGGIQFLSVNRKSKV